MTVADLEEKAEPRMPSVQASMNETMKHRLATKTGRELYKLRMQTAEPVSRIIKEAMGFGRFSLRGAAKVATEWVLVCLAYNMRRLLSMLSRSGEWTGGRMS